MKADQKLNPKYWVVHDKTTDDVFIDTAHKTKQNSIELFLNKHSFNYFGVIDDEALEEKFLISKKLDCILIEILPILIGK